MNNFSTTVLERGLDIKMPGTIAYILLTAQEVKCLKIVLYFLQEQLSQKNRHPLFVEFRVDLLQHLNWWLSHQGLVGNFLLYPGKSVRWPIVSTEDPFWLMLAMVHGLTDQTLVSLATDHANYERDQWIIRATSLEDVVLASEKRQHHLSLYLKHYRQAAQEKGGLLKKFVEIVKHNYFLDKKIFSFLPELMS